jgi:hypothetical protein
VEGGGGSPRKANKSQGKTFTHHLPQMSKIQNISIETKKVSIYLDKILIYLDKISISHKYLDLSRFVLTILIFLDDLDKYLVKNKSRPKNLDFKNLDREKIKIDLDVMDNLDGF